MGKGIDLLEWKAGKEIAMYYEYLEEVQGDTVTPEVEWTSEIEFTPDFDLDD